ncbi:hypothetical protein MICAF_170010 [Microcystis aeruginosa PCC 9807]|uniref:Uncharacterized protein n=1 Tax=Microcystis aeruginosa PCC 9807 TaxID=1160283 RepID=I4H1P8_MICAE|nr:hypothetical protein [Microcystis aeruginosa]CCI15972.1 hypothetical protein MICAF_170010 [Microcystis aeruginosa PCC 9807]
MTNEDDDQHLPLAWEKGKVVAQFLGVIANTAIAVVVFLVGSAYNQQIENQKLAQNLRIKYIDLALQIIKNSGSGDKIRTWAADVIQVGSESVTGTPMDEETKKQLKLWGLQEKQTQSKETNVGTEQTIADGITLDQALQEALTRNPPYTKRGDPSKYTDFNLFICNENSSVATPLANLIAYKLDQQNHGEIQVKVLSEGEEKSEFTTLLPRGAITVITDEGHPENGEWGRISDLLQKAIGSVTEPSNPLYKQLVSSPDDKIKILTTIQKPDIKQQFNAGKYSPWRISIFICPKPSD